jgi:deoxycytidine triphosphate deaminase
MLSDHDLREMLPQFAIATDDRSQPFQPEVQIQPSSIDLRLDRCFWRPRKPLRGRILDLRLSGSGSIDMARLFVAHWSNAGQGITLKPGEMILGRTFEKFAIPNGFAGQIHGRSSYARLGLTVHCTGGFVNPGWHGRMPLQLVNHGAVPVVIMPYLPVCQLAVTRTSTPSDRPYGSPDSGHVYADDDGGPSRFWLSRSLNSLRQHLGKPDVSKDLQEELFQLLKRRDIEVMDRFSFFFARLQKPEITSAREILERFSKKDVKRFEWHSRTLKFLRWFCFLTVGASITAIFKPPYGKLQLVTWIVSALLLVPGCWAQFFASEPDEAFTAKEVAELCTPAK